VKAFSGRFLASHSVAHRAPHLYPTSNFHSTGISMPNTPPMWGLAYWAARRAPRAPTKALPLCSSYTTSMRLGRGYWAENFSFTMDWAKVSMPTKFLSGKRRAT
jgi:hypothetical protein